MHTQEPCPRFRVYCTPVKTKETTCTVIYCTVQYRINTDLGREKNLNKKGTPVFKIDQQVIKLQTLFVEIKNGFYCKYKNTFYVHIANIFVNYIQGKGATALRKTCLAFSLCPILKV